MSRRGGVIDYESDEQHEYEADFDPYTPPPGLRDLEADYPSEHEPVAAENEVRGWVERVDRKVGVRSYAGGLAIVIALAGAIIAIVIALGARDESATKNQLQSLKTEVSQAAEEANKETAGKVDDLAKQVNEISNSVSDLQSSSSTDTSSIDALQGDIDDLKGQISDLQSSASVGDTSGGVSPTPGHSIGDDLRHALGGN